MILSRVFRQCRAMCLLPLIGAALLLACTDGPGEPGSAVDTPTPTPPPQQTPSASVRPEPTPQTPAATSQPGSGTAPLATPTPDARAGTTPVATATPPGPTPIPPALTSPETDRAALVAIYNALGGEEWRRKDNWLTNAPLGDWYGVDTDTDGRVTTLDLWDPFYDDRGGVGLVGQLPEELGLLADLKYLRLRRNEGLTGPLPSWIGNLAGLETLDLEGTGLTGELPPELETLTFLVPASGTYDGLSIGNSGLCVPQQLQETLRPKIRHIPVLCRERELLVAIYNALGGEEWRRKDNWLTDAPLGDWYGVDTDTDGRVTTLDLWDPFYDDRGGVGLVGQLPEELGLLADLKYLRLRRNEGLTGPLPSWIGNLAGLETLDLDETGLTGCVPTALQVNLGTSARPFGSNASETDPFCSAGSTQTARVGAKPETPGTDLDLGHSGDREVLEEFFRNTGGPSFFAQTGWKRTDNWMDSEVHLNDWYGVTTDNTGRVIYLQLAENELKGEIPSSLSELARLTELNLRNNELTGSIPSELGRLKRLTHLNLRDNDFAADACVPHALTEVGTDYLIDGLDFCKSPAEQAKYDIRQGIYQDLLALKALYNNTKEHTDWARVRVREEFSVNGAECFFWDLKWTPDDEGTPDLSQWCGVTTNSDGRVIKLELGGIGAVGGEGLGIGLSGKIPSELQQLTELQVLDLSNGKVCGTFGCSGGLTGTLPSELARNPKLTHIDISGNELDGQLEELLGDFAARPAGPRFYLSVASNKWNTISEVGDAWTTWAGELISGKDDPHVITENDLKNVKSLYENWEELKGNVQMVTNFLETPGAKGKAIFGVKQLAKRGAAELLLEIPTSVKGAVKLYYSTTVLQNPLVQKFVDSLILGAINGWSVDRITGFFVDGVLPEGVENYYAYSKCIDERWDEGKLDSSGYEECSNLHPQNPP